MEGKSYGIAGYDLSITVSQWYNKWMELYVIHSKKNTTINNYVNGYERIREYIGYFKMIEVKPDNILSVIKSLQNEGYKRATIVHSLTILKLMFQKAFDSKMIPSNPVQDIKLPARDYAPASNDVEKDLQCISVTQSETFFKACKDTRYYELFYLLIHTGMRIGDDDDKIRLNQRKPSKYKGTEKLPFFLKWKFFFYIFSIFFRKSTKKLWLTP